MTFISENTLLPSSSSSSPLMDWLTFSLSNNPHYQNFDHEAAFNTTTSDHQEINATGGPCSSTSSDLSMLSFGGATGCGGPKLEDFLGVCGTTTTTTTTAQPVCQFSGEGFQSVDATAMNHSNNNNNNTFYDSSDHHHQLMMMKNITAAAAASSYSMIMTTDLNPVTEVVNPVVVVSSLVSNNKKAMDTFGQRTSIYRGVTRHRWTGRYEAHLWDNSCRREGQSRKGRQVYLGGYDKEDKAARAYDLAALKYWGPTTTTNFPVSNYEKEIDEMTNMNRQEFVASLRRKSSGFSRGASMYRGVTRHHQHGRWQARIGRVAGNKDLYLGTFSTQEEAAEAYDIAAIKFRGLNAVTNFDMSRYDVKSIANSNLPIGGITGKSKPTSETISDNNNKSSSTSSVDEHRDFSSSSSIPFALQPPPSSTTSSSSSCSLSFAMSNIKPDPASDYWSLLGSPSQNKNPNSSAIMTTGFLDHHGSGFDHDHSTKYSSSNLNIDLCSSNTDDFDQTNKGYSFFNGVIEGGGYVQQLQNCSSSSSATTTTTTSSMIPYATIPINMNTSYSASSSGSWVVAPSLHGFQTVNPSLSVFQTPIFGME